jgi:tRNA modification GTPase
MDSVFAVCSAPGKAAISIIRISGPAVRHCAAELLKRVPRPRYAFSGPIGTADPRGIALFFPKPHSFTGEDVLELHAHGNPVIIARLMKEIKACATKEFPIRIAERGEFTKRAFLNGKMDLTQVEALADLMSAMTEKQCVQASKQMKGELGLFYDRLREDLVRVLAHVEAVIDFADEEDDVTEHVVLESIRPDLERIKLMVQKHLDDSRRGEIIREGLGIVLIGAPNAGKSSLLNALAQRNVAIVTDIPGTTRDVIETTVDIGGYPVVLSDTAGIRETSDLVEAEGVFRAKEKARAANIQLLVVDSSLGKDHVLETLDQMKWAWKKKEEDNSRQKTLIVLNKWDKVLNDIDFFENIGKEIQRKFHWGETLKITRASCISNQLNGLDHLLQEMEMQIASMLENNEYEEVSIEENENEIPVITRERYRQHLNDVLMFLEDFQDESKDLVLRAEDLRQAANCLGKITGRIDIEQILDVIFRDFCIGK